MAAGEYISVASQRDTEQADIDKEREALNSGPQVRQMELEELTQIYVQRGLNDRLAREVAVALTEKDAVRAHARVSITIFAGQDETVCHVWLHSNYISLTWMHKLLKPKQHVLLDSISFKDI